LKILRAPQPKVTLQVTNQERQALIDSITPEEVAKIEAKNGVSIKVEVEDIIEAEFLMKFGWEAYWSLYPEKDRAKGIGSKEMLRILVASRKVDMGNMFKDTQAAFIGAVAAQSKKPSNTFKLATSKMLKKSEADK